MNFENLDVVELLEKKQEHHLEQLKRIKLALAALKGDVKPSKSNVAIHPKTPWTEKVMELLDKNNEGMNLDQILNDLAEGGIVEALDPKNRQTIYSTLSRGLKKGVLEKVGYGVYRKKQTRAERVLQRVDRASKFTRRDQNNEGSEPSNHPEPSS